MIKNYSLLFGIVASIFICLYLSMYILRNIYYYFENKSFRKFINKLLPIFSKYNLLLLILALIFSLLHVIFIFIYTSIFNSGYIVLFILILIFKFTFFSSKNSNTNFILNILSYLLLLSLFVHYFI